MKILIAGLDPANVLVNLYNHAEKPSLFDQYFLGCPGKLDRARALILSGQTYFDEVDLGQGPRILKITLTRLFLNAEAYDQHHGAGLASRVIQTLQFQLSSDYNRASSPLQFSLELSETEEHSDSDDILKPYRSMKFN